MAAVGEAGIHRLPAQEGPHASRVLMQRDGETEACEHTMMQGQPEEKVTYNYFVYIKIDKRSSQLQEHQQYNSCLTSIKNEKGFKDCFCCPVLWSSFQSSCYFISTELKNWTDSEKICSALGAYLMVINTKDEQQFIMQKLDRKFAYYFGLSDPEGNRQWQWVDQSPYKKSVSFWHSGEPNNNDEHCVILNSRGTKEDSASWGWNDAFCDVIQRSICEMKMKNL
ncbi:PREDICTED: C-type lectin domain family 4 member C [Elephantulus edwardii]|uniref:C-type lectin domain family 4 member C n=1 Tax=Elephantulus edwardii TaxID=28737 RepID=UPI0003F0CF20|nr:PREDICTED: C-type lectin domain family 4 member C [Elephantulus edwardii]